MTSRQNILAAAIGLLAGGTAFFILHQKSSEIMARTTPVEVLVASRYIPAGSALREEMAERKTVPKAFVAPSAITDTREVEGFRSFAPFSAGEQLLSNKFGLGSPTLSSSLAPGRRAFTLEVDEKGGVGGLLQPGDRVDLLTRAVLNGREVTSTAFQNLEVLAVGQALKKGPNREGEEDSPQTGGYGTVTLSVTPQEAEILFYLEGRPLALTLRAPGDEETASLPPLTEGDLLGRLGKGSSRSGKRSIEIIKPFSQGDPE